MEQIRLPVGSNSGNTTGVPVVGGNFFLRCLRKVDPPGPPGDACEAALPLFLLLLLLLLPAGNEESDARRCGCCDFGGCDGTAVGAATVAGAKGPTVLDAVAVTTELGGLVGSGLIGVVVADTAALTGLLLELTLCGCGDCLKADVPLPLPWNVGMAPPLSSGKGAYRAISGSICCKMLRMVLCKVRQN